MVTYKELYELWRLEERDAELQSLGKDFYSQVAKYRKDLDSELSSAEENSVKKRLLLKEKNNSEKLIRLLVKKRIVKLKRSIEYGMSIDFGCLTVEEENIGKGETEVTSSLNSLLENSLSAAQVKSSTEGEDLKEKRLILRFLRDTPAVVGPDMQVYGPFQKEDVASIPLENAEIFLKHGIAKKIDVV